MPVAPYDNDVSEWYAIGDYHLREPDRTKNVALSFVSNQVGQYLRPFAPLVDEKKQTWGKIMEQDKRDKDDVGQISTKVDVKSVSAETISRIQELQEPYQRAVHLHYVERQSYPDIARQFGKPIGTVKSYIHRGKKMLQKILKQTESDEPSHRGKVEAPDNTTVDIAASISGVPETYREAIRLRFLEHLSYPEIAQRLHKPIGTVKSYIHRGKKYLI